MSSSAVTGLPAEAGKLKLKSDDGEVFDVDTYHLKSSSAVFRDMLSSTEGSSPFRLNSGLAKMSLGVHHGARSRPGAPSATDTCVPIDIPASSQTVRLLICLISHDTLPDLLLTPSSSQLARAYRKPARRPRSPIPKPEPRNRLIHLVELLEILARFDCGPALRERALAYFEPLYGEDPWMVFCIAAKSCDVALGKRAIGSFGELEEKIQWKVDPEKMDPVEAEKVPLPWLMGYWRAYTAAAAAQRKLQKVPNQTHGLCPDFWAEVAASFVVATARPPPPPMSYFVTTKLAEFYEQ